LLFGDRRARFRTTLLGFPECILYGFDFAPPKRKKHNMLIWESIKPNRFKVWLTVVIWIVTYGAMRAAAKLTTVFIRANGLITTALTDRMVFYMIILKLVIFALFGVTAYVAACAAEHLARKYQRQIQK
jgi:hypothetical protein